MFVEILKGGLMTLYYVGGIDLHVSSVQVYKPSGAEALGLYRRKPCGRLSWKRL